MADDKQKPGWRAIGTSVRGAAHVRAGLPKQDAIGWIPESGEALPLIMAVSDGHGSAKCFRSDAGALLAIHTTLQTMQEFVNGQLTAVSLSAIKRTAEEQLPQELLRRWRAAVEGALRNTPFSVEELAMLEQKDGPAARQSVEANPFLAYGATLLIVLVAASFLLYLQLGDGDILTVTETGEVERPVPGDARLLANETTSLCTPNAWHDMRVRFQVLAGPPPALILLSTDGYANSFRDDAGFFKVGSALLDIIRTDGLDKVRESLEGWLTETTQAGSGDDITLGILCRMEAVQQEGGTPPPAE
jgi:protein phosphatase 2C-like protein